MSVGFHVSVLVSPDFNQTWISHTILKIHPVGADMFHMDRQARQS